MDTPPSPPHEASDRPSDLQEIPSLVELLHDQARRRNHPDPDRLFEQKSAREYLERVSNLSIEALQREPSLIKEESSFVSSELTALCFREYRTFISVHALSSSVSTAFSSFTSSLDALLDSSIPDLEAECHAFAASTKETQHERRKGSLVLVHHDKLQDLLEVPVLLETCVRNGYYHEAMELGEHARRMSERYGDVPIVRDVEREVDKGLLAMLVQLLSLLREPVKLPSLIKAVGFLRRLDVLSEEELRVAFITSRDSNFRAQLVGIERERANPVKFVRRYVDLFRENVYDAISHYTTIFLDGAPSSPPSSSTTSGRNASDSSAELLITFTHRSLTHLVNLLESHIPLIDDPSSLASILTQLNYCSNSFARVGLDFRALIAKPFERAVLNAFTKGLAEAESGLESALKDALRNRRPPAAWMVPVEELAIVLDSYDTTAISSTATAPTSSIYAPPPHLSHFPSLALFCNAHTNTLNSLRLFAPISLFHALRKAQLASLARSAASILTYAQTASSDVLSIPGPTGNSSPLVSSPSVSGANSPLIGKGGRPGHRRNPSVSAGPSEKEKKDAQLVMVAYGRAYADGLASYLRRALVEGVFGGELGTLEEVNKRGVDQRNRANPRSKEEVTDEGLDELGQLKSWLDAVEEGLRPARPVSLPLSASPPTLGSIQPLKEQVEDEPLATATEGAEPTGAEPDQDLDLAKVDEGIDELDRGQDEEAGEID